MGEINQSVQIGSYGRWFRVNALFDSGADMSYIKLSLAKKINAPIYSKVKTRLGDGSELQGYLSQINVKIKNRIGLSDVIVVHKLDGDLILGQDWMQKNDIILNMKKEKFTYGLGQPKIKKIYRLR